MIRSLAGVLILFGGIFWLPLWAQISLFVGSVFLLPNRWMFLIPSVFSDVFYSPSSTLSISNFKMTAIVFVSIIICELIVRNMRVGDKYDVLEK
jgi:hypothetical protein